MIFCPTETEPRTREPRRMGEGEVVNGFKLGRSRVPGRRASLDARLKRDVIGVSQPTVRSVRVDDRGPEAGRSTWGLRELCHIEPTRATGCRGLKRLN